MAENINKTPNNLCRELVTDCSQKHCSNRLPHEEYNDMGELVGYSWAYGDTLSFEFNLEGKVTVESGSIFYPFAGEEPTSSTVGEIGQKAYNPIDLKSWTCIQINPFNPIYVWKQDESYQMPNKGEDVFFLASDYLKDKYLKVTIYNYKFEKEFESLPYQAETRFVFDIDKELSDKLLRGVHHIELVLYDQDYMYVDTLIDPSEYSLIVQ